MRQYFPVVSPATCYVPPDSLTSRSIAAAVAFIAYSAFDFVTFRDAPPAPCAVLSLFRIVATRIRGCSKKFSMAELFITVLSRGEAVSLAW